MWKGQNATILEGKEYPILSRKSFAKLTPKAGRVSSTFLLPPVVILCTTDARGVRYHQPFRGPIRLTNYNFHAHVHYCVTIHYHMCCIGKYKNVEGLQCVSLWLGEICLSLDQLE